MASSDIRSQAIECMAEAGRSTLAVTYTDEAIDMYNALLAAGFEILAPGELQVAPDHHDESCASLPLWGQTTFPCDCRQPVYVRTDGGDAS